MVATITQTRLIDTFTVVTLEELIIIAVLVFVVHIHAHEKILWGRGGGGGCHQTVIVNIMRERTANELIYQISHQNDIHITVDETAGIDFCLTAILR